LVGRSALGGRSLTVAALTVYTICENGISYVRRHAEAITAADRLRPQVSLAARGLLTHGTGAMEKNIEVWIGRRFKRWGLLDTTRPFLTLVSGHGFC